MATASIPPSTLPIPPQEQIRPGRWFLLACLLSCIPLWLSTYLPMGDLSIHAHQVATFKRLMTGTEHFTSLYAIQWFTPYWIGYAPIAALALFLPITVAIKIVLSLAMALIPWYAARLRALVHHDNSYDWLFLPIAYGFSFQWGFLNFIIGIPIALFFIAYSIQYFSSPTTRLKQAVIITLTGLLLFASHILLLAFSLLIIVPIGFLLSKYYFTDHQKTKLIFVHKLLPFIIPLPPIFFWLISNQYYLKNNITPRFSMWIINLYRLPFLISNSTGCLYFFSIGFIYATAIFILPKFKLQKNWKAWPIICTTCIILFCPTNILGTNYIAERFSIFILIFYIFSFKIKNIEKIYSKQTRTLIVASTSTLILISTSFKIVRYDKTTLGFKAILNRMEPYRSVMSFMPYAPRNYSEPILAGPSEWYAAEKDGICNFSFSAFQGIIQYQNRRTEIFLDNPANPLTFDWKKYGTHFDYFILQGDISKFSNAFKTNLSRYAYLIHAEGNWYLYARKQL